MNVHPGGEARVELERRGHQPVAALLERRGRAARRRARTTRAAAASTAPLHDLVGRARPGAPWPSRAKSARARAESSQRSISPPCVIQPSKFVVGVVRSRMNCGWVPRGRHEQSRRSARRPGRGPRAAAARARPGAAHPAPLLVVAVPVADARSKSRARRSARVVDARLAGERTASRAPGRDDLGRAVRSRRAAPVRAAGTPR